MEWRDGACFRGVPGGGERRALLRGMRERDGDKDGAHSGSLERGVFAIAAAIEAASATVMLLMHGARGLPAAAGPRRGQRHRHHRRHND